MATFFARISLLLLRLRYWYGIKFKGYMPWYSPKDSTPQYQCPCCDYFTLPERGQYLICPVCFWEDEGGEDLDMIGTTSVTLRQARINFKKFGASEEKAIEHVCSAKERNKYRQEVRNF